MQQGIGIHLEEVVRLVARLGCLAGFIVDDADLSLRVGLYAVDITAQPDSVVEDRFELAFATSRCQLLWVFQSEVGVQ
jgi:hypothetical protein